MTTSTLVILKPDALRRGLEGAILARLAGAGFRIARLETRRPTRAQWASHYCGHAKQPYFRALIEFMESGPVLIGILERRDGREAAISLRELAGGWAEPRDPATIRGEFMVEGEPTMANLIHGSDSPEEAEREIALWFGVAGVATREDANAKHDAIRCRSCGASWPEHNDDDCPRYAYRRWVKGRALAVAAAGGHANGEDR